MATGQHIELTINTDLVFGCPWNYPKLLKLRNVPDQALSKQCQQSSTRSIHKDYVVTHTQTDYYNPPVNNPF